MKRVIGLILVGVGVFALILAPMLKFYSAPKLAVAPMDVDSLSTGEGVLVKKLNPAKISSFPDVYDENIPVTTSRYTVADPQAAATAPEGNTGVYNTFIRINEATGEKGLLSASTATYAFDRSTSELINCCGANSNGKNVNFTGVMPLKFPFNPAKGTIEVWDDALGKTIGFEYVGEIDLFGYTASEYRAVVPPTRVTGEEPFLSLPNTVVGLPGEGNTELFAYQSYDNVLYVQPVTGELLGGSTKSTQTLRTKTSNTDVVTVSSADIKSAPKEDAVSESFATAASLNLISNTVPLVSLILGIILIVIGALLARRPKEAGTNSAA